MKSTLTAHALPRRTTRRRVLCAHQAKSAACATGAATSGAAQVPLGGPTPWWTTPMSCNTPGTYTTTLEDGKSVSTTKQRRRATEPDPVDAECRRLAPGRDRDRDRPCP